MKSYKRLLSVLLVFLLLSVQFSTIANASNDYDLSSLYWRIMFADNSFNYIGDSLPTKPLNHLWKASGEKKTHTYPQYMLFEYTPSSEGFNLATSTIIVEKGDGFSVQLDNYKDSFVYYDTSGNVVTTLTRKIFEPESCYVQLFDISGNYESVTPTNYETGVSNGRISFSVDIDTVPFDVYRFRVVFYDNTTSLFNFFDGTKPDTYATWYREMLFDTYSSHSIKNIPEEKGLLKSIIAWLQSIKDGITDLFDSIAELPSKIWSFIENGLKSLFVPDSDYMSSYSDKWDSLLSSRFGAVYQVGAFVMDFFETVFDYSAKSPIISFPCVTINLPDGNTFTFPRNSTTYQVRAIPSGFNSVADTLKVIVGIVGTFFFCNGLLKRYDEFMGVEK